MITPDWPELAECRGADRALFFPKLGASLKPALAYCDRCPVADECLAAAIEEEAGSAPVGVRGGRSALQRRRDRAQLTRAIAS